MQSTQNKTELDRALEDLQSLLDTRLDTQGGYPAEVRVIGKWIAIADVDHDEAPTLEILDVSKYLKMWRLAKKAYRQDWLENADMDMAGHLWEQGYPDRCRYEPWSDGGGR